MSFKPLLTSFAVSQFTLYGKLKKGNKPDFHDAADAQTARRLYDYFYNKMRDSYVADRVKNGVFQAMMDVELKNDGPVGVDYRSEDAAVYFCLPGFSCAAIATMLICPWMFYRSRSRSIPTCRRKNPRNPRLTAPTRTKRRATKSPLQAHRASSSRSQLNCCNRIERWHGNIHGTCI